MKFAIFFLTITATIASGQFSFVYSDAAGTGFLSTEARTPVGGNIGTTLGEQRRLALEKAAAIWEEYLVIEGPVEVLAGFEELAPGTLAGARALDVERDFPGAPEADTWYPSALANHITKTDRFPGDSEIEVVVNSTVDDSGSGFYYGLDGAGGTSDFVRVLIHELGHGLGFFSLADNNDGSFFLGSPSIFAKNLYDIELSQTWDQMTASERGESTVKGTFLRWNGNSTPPATASQVTSGLPLGNVDVIIGGLVTATYPATLASFGPSLSPAGLSGSVVVADDGTPPSADVCEPITNGGAINGNIALVDRGICFFTDKVIAAEGVGATAVIIANNVDGAFVMSGDAPFPGIPSVLVTQATGTILRTLPAGAQVTIRPEPTAGLHEEQPLMFNPLVLEPGSSVSHFDINTSPNLLMEPVIGINREDPDLALTIMRDLGWKVRDLPFPNLTYDLWETDRVTGATGRNADGDNDGHDNFDEYAFGSDPNNALSTPTDATLTINGANEAEIHFVRSDQTTDVDFRILNSTTAQGLSEIPSASGSFSEVASEQSEETRNLGTPAGREFYQVEASEE